jgi:hypothetical protein
MSSEAMAGWERFGTGLPNTLVDDLRIVPGGIMTAAEFGHGAYQVTLPAP